MLRYFGSSIFALWWCQETDGIEEEQDNEKEDCDYHAGRENPHCPECR
jgi:hypothetical protein